MNRKGDNIVHKKYARPTPSTGGNLRPIVPCEPLPMDVVFANCQRDYGMEVTLSIWRSHPAFEDWLAVETF